MSHIMSIYRRLNPRLLVQAGVGLGLLHWANMSNISLTKIKHIIGTPRTRELCGLALSAYIHGGIP